LKLIDPVWGNYFAKCPRFNPSDVLKQLRPFELDDPKVRSIPSKRGSEIAEACLFCFGLSCRMGCPIWVIDDQSADHDFLAFRKDNGDEIFYPIQLKRVVPERVNAQDTLQSIIEGLAKYVSSGDLAVAISVNRRMDLDPDAITLFRSARRAAQRHRFTPDPQLGGLRHPGPRPVLLRSGGHRLCQRRRPSRCQA
jgi:hypothetical protein